MKTSWENSVTISLIQRLVPSHARILYLITDASLTFRPIKRDLENPQEHRDLVDAYFKPSTDSSHSTSDDKKLAANEAGPVRAAVEAEGDTGADKEIV